MSYDRQTGVSGGASGNPPSLQEIGAKIAGNQGGFQYEPRPGGSTSGGAVPERNTFQGVSGTQEPGYEHISAPHIGSGSGGGIIESSGGPTYNPSSLGQQGSSYTQPQQHSSGGISNLGAGSGTTGSKPETGSATIGGAGINKETVGTGTGSSTPATGGTTGGYQGVVGNAQKTVEPYVAQAREAAAPYVQKAQEVGSAALEQARPILNQAAGVASQAGQVGLEKAQQAYNVAATELDARGINKDSTQQKLAEVGQTMKDYGAVGQQRAGEYFQQAVDQAKTIGQDGENKSIVATIFGTVFLVWLAFGFSIGAVFALGVAGSIAALLSRYSRGQVSSRPGVTSGQQSYGQTSATQPTSGQANYGQSTTGQLPSGRIPGTTSNLATPGVETHYPRPSHPDNSLHTNLGN